MKKRYIIIGLLSSYLAASAQRTEQPYRKKQLSRTDVRYLFSYYTQDNDHSAVTGGIGTEDLQVYATQFAFDHLKDSTYAFHFDTGIDIISSASTDNIDFNVSSASKTDARTHVNLGYDRVFRKRGITAGLNTGFSIESDYLSYAAGLSFNKINSSQTQEISVSLQAFFDDLRWGRFENGHPQKLIYPFELRYKNWFDNYRRTSVNLDVGIYRTINKRMAIGFYPGIAYQKGLLSTPFHRVYFTDDSKRVENLPGERLKIPIGVHLNSFLGSAFILRTSYRFYWDDFGIISHTINAEGVAKISQVFSVTAFARLYFQDAAESFKPYKEHDVDEAYYTSDYDLSRFTSIKPGVGLRYSPYAVRKRVTFNALEFRYAFYHRSDGLRAHAVSLFINYTLDSKKKRLD